MDHPEPLLLVDCSFYSGNELKFSGEHGVHRYQRPGFAHTQRTARFSRNGDLFYWSGSLHPTRWTPTFPLPSTEKAPPCCHCFHATHGEQMTPATSWASTIENEKQYFCSHHHPSSIRHFCGESKWTGYGHSIAYLEFDICEVFQNAKLFCLALNRGVSVYRLTR